jgi:hypothetical protein
MRQTLDQRFLHEPRRSDLFKFGNAKPKSEKKKYILCLYDDKNLLTKYKDKQHKPGANFNIQFLIKNQKYLALNVNTCLTPFPFPYCDILCHFAIPPLPPFEHVFFE